MTTPKAKLFSNFLSLSFQQVIIIIFPFAIFPYLLRVLDVYGFGIFSLIQTIIMYLDLLIAFGLNLTATELIAKCNENKEEESKIICAVYYIKLMMFLCSVLCLFLCYLFIPYVQENSLLILYSAAYLFGNLLFPDWYFKGIQKMNNCTLVTFLSKLISLVLIFNLVKQENDVDIVFLCLALGNIIAGIVGVVLLNNKAKGWYKKNSLIFPKQLFIESSYVFFSIILVPFYSSINLFILQYFYTPLVVGIYSAAHKIFMACSMLVNVINNTLFPYLAKISITSFDDYKQNVKTTIIMLSIGFSIFSFSIFLFADQIITLVTGANSGYEFNTMALVLKIMCFALLFSPFVSFFFQQIIILNKKRQAIVNIIITIIVNLIVGTILAYLYGVIGMAIGMCITTLLIFTLHFSSVKKHIFQRQNIFLI